MRRLEPPARAYRLLQRALGPDPAGPAILGDLHEDFIRVVERSGPRRAALWYWWEAARLVAGRGLRARMRGSGSGSGGGPAPGILKGWLQDAGSALRAVRRNPGFAAFAIVIVGLGVGASTAVYSVMRPLLLAPLPFDDPEALVWVANDQEGTSLSHVTSRTSNLRDFRAENRSFLGLTGFNAFFGQSQYTLAGDGEAEQLTGVGVAHDFLSVLGVRPLHGRDFTIEEGTWNGPAAVILTHGFWNRRFGGDPSVVGTAITLDDRPWEVVGILPPSFDFSSVFTPTTDVDFLRTFAISDETDRWGNTLSMVGRLRPGTTVPAAQADLDGIIEGLQAADPERWGLGAVVTPLQQQIAAPFRAGMWLLAAAAGTVMLIVCANLSNMLLARSPKRRREVAIRRTFGATRGRLVRQFVLESLLLASGGALVGLAIAVGATRVVSGTTGFTIPMLRSVSVDGSALFFTVALTVLAGIAIGIVPALQVSEAGEAAALKGGGTRSRGDRGASRLRDGLVVSEIALACVLLVLGGLFLRSFRAVLNVDLGYAPSGAVAWQLHPSRDFDSYQEMTTFYRQVSDAVEALPGVESAGLIDALPLGRNRTWGMRVVGAEYEGIEEGNDLFPHMIDPGYLETMGIPLLRGRRFHREDVRDTDPVVLINASGADELFGGSDALGHFLSIGGSDVEWRIVGVVGDVRHQTLESDAGIQVYFPMAQMWDFSTMDLVVRSSVAPEILAGSVSQGLLALDSGMPTREFWTLEETVAQASSARRFILALLGVFAGVALLLAALGVYGVLSYSVAERIPEIGVRMALGATAADVRTSVVARTLMLAAAGIGLGVVVSLAGSGLVASLLFGVEPTDPFTFIGMVAVLLTVAILAGLLPAIRASRTDSVTALRA